MDERTSDRDAVIRARNRRTGWILATVALAFFLGAIVRFLFHWQ